MGQFTGIKILTTVGVLALTLFEARANLIVNSGFEDDAITLTGWSVTTPNGTAQITTQTGNIHSGANAALLTVTGTGGFDLSLAQTPNVTLGLKYLLTFWLKVKQVNALPASPAGATVTILGDSGNPIFTPTEDWIQYSYLTAALSENPTEILFKFKSPLGTEFYLDDVSFAAVPETGTVVAGLLLLLPFGAGALRAIRRNSARSQNRHNMSHQGIADESLPRHHHPR